MVAIQGKDGDISGSLAEEYSGRIAFRIGPAFPGGKPDPELDSFKFGKARHGLVAHDADGKIAFVMPGHNYGAAEMREKLDALLAE